MGEREGKRDRIRNNRRYRERERGGGGGGGVEKREIDFINI